MLPFLLSAALATAQPSPCPIDIVVSNPRLKVVRVRDRAFENNIITVSIANTGTATQRTAVRQHLDLLFGSTVIGSQPIPALGPQENYEAAFRFQDKYEKKRQPRPMTLRFVIDSKAVPGENCTTSNDQVTTTL